jgi:hypothetical protein
VTSEEESLNRAKGVNSDRTAARDAPKPVEQSQAMTTAQGEAPAQVEVSDLIVAAQRMRPQTAVILTLDRTRRRPRFKQPWRKREPSHKGCIFTPEDPSARKILAGQRFVRAATTTQILRARVMCAPTVVARTTLSLLRRVISTKRTQGARVLSACPGNMTTQTSRTTPVTLPRLVLPPSCDSLRMTSALRPRTSRTSDYQTPGCARLGRRERLGVQLRDGPC